MRLKFANDEMGQALAVRLFEGEPRFRPHVAIARQVGLSPVHLSRLFQEELGSIPRSYFEKRRIDHAYRRLRMPDTRIKEVAIALGFDHLLHFSNWFRKHSHQSPRDFLKANNQVPTRTQYS